MPCSHETLLKDIEEELLERGLDVKVPDDATPVFLDTVLVAFLDQDGDQKVQL